MKGHSCEVMIKRGGTTRYYARPLSNRIEDGLFYCPPLNLMSFLVRHKLVESKSEVRRLVKQKGISINTHKILEAEIMD